MNVDRDNKLTGHVIGAAIAVHRELGPGLDEPVYEEMLSAQLTANGIRHECQAPLPLQYKGVKLDCGYRMDLLGERPLVVELKSERGKTLPARFREVEIADAVEIPLLVSGELPVVCLSVPKLTPLHQARLLARLRQGEWPSGLLLNFNVTALPQGIRRVVHSGGEHRRDAKRGGHRSHSSYPSHSSHARPEHRRDAKDAETG